MLHTAQGPIQGRMAGDQSGPVLHTAQGPIHDLGTDDRDGWQGRMAGTDGRRSKRPRRCNKGVFRAIGCQETQSGTYYS